MGVRPASYLRNAASATVGSFINSSALNRTPAGTVEPKGFIASSLVYFRLQVAPADIEARGHDGN